MPDHIADKLRAKLAPVTEKSLDWLDQFALLNDEERLRAFDLLRERYCLHCGVADPQCQCWNDE